MRGPGYRRGLDVRRTWKCPACASEVRVGADVTTVRCDCQPAGVWMRIETERNAVPRPLQPASLPEIPVADFQLTEEELSKPLEGRMHRRMPAPEQPERRTGRPQPAPSSQDPDNNPEESTGEQSAPAGRQQKFERPKRERGRRNVEPQAQSSNPAVMNEQQAPVDENPAIPEAGGDSFGEGLE